MGLFFHELKRNRLSLLVWTGVISFMLAICVLIYPEMSAQMGDISEVFADMGSFTAAFGMDELDFGEFMGFFAVECGNVLGMGGAFFAAVIGICALSGEEKEGTAEFLLAHPISRKKVIAAKLCAVFFRITVMNLTVAAITVLSVLIIGEKADVKVMALIFIAYYIMQIEIAAVTFGISAFIKGSGIGIGLGLAVGFYFVIIISNLTKDLEFLKYITPFGYTEGADIVSNEALNMGYLAVGALAFVAGITAAFLKYPKKDIV